MERLLELIFPPECVICGTLLTGKDQKNELPENPGFSRARSVLCMDCSPREIITTGAAASSSLSSAQLSAQLSAQDSGLHRPALSAFQRGSYCERCGELTTCWGPERRTCVVCFLWPAPVRSVRSLFRYSQQVKALVCGLKYGKRRAIAKYLGRLLAEAVDQKDPRLYFENQDWDLIVPIPSSSQSLQERGFHHMALVVREFASCLRLPTALTALEFKDVRSPQASLPIARRHKNMEGAFRAKAKLVRGRRILLLDDVLTTGASIWQAASALLDAGAQQVDALTVARAKDFQNQRLVSGQENRSGNGGDPFNLESNEIGINIQKRLGNS